MYITTCISVTWATAWFYHMISTDFTREMKIIYGFFLFIAFANANAADIVLHCKTKPYGLKEVNPSEMLDGFYTIINDGSHIKIGENSRLLPLETSPSEYKWTWPIDETKPLVIVESINRITGAYTLTATKNNITKIMGDGICQRGEVKF